jgi:hypothetical protein
VVPRDQDDGLLAERITRQDIPNGQCIGFNPAARSGCHEESCAQQARIQHGRSGSEEDWFVRAKRVRKKPDLPEPNHFLYVDLRTLL